MKSVLKTPSEAAARQPPLPWTPRAAQMLRPSTAAATGLVVPLWCPLARARPRAGIGVAAVPRGGASAAQGRHHRRHVSIAAGSRPYPLPDPPAPLVPSLAQNLGDYSTWDRLQLVDR